MYIIFVMIAGATLGVINVNPLWSAFVISAFGALEYLLKDLLNNNK